MTAYNPTWVLVADAARARLFQYDGFGASIKQLKEWTHADSRARNQDLVTDRPGRVMQSRPRPQAGHGSRSGMEPALPPKRMEHERFAREIQSELEQGLDKNAYGRLVIVANPEFLGTLRHVASPQVVKHTVASLDKDYTMMGIVELEQRLAPILHA